MVPRLTVKALGRVLRRNGIAEKRRLVPVVAVRVRAAHLEAGLATGRGGGREYLPARDEY
jgi:hypothetical protein